MTSHKEHSKLFKTVCGELVLEMPGINAQGVDKSRRAFLDLVGRNRNSNLAVVHLKEMVGDEALSQWGVNADVVRYSVYCEDMSMEPDIPKGVMIHGRSPFCRFDKDEPGKMMINKGHLARLSQLQMHQ